MKTKNFFAILMIVSVLTIAVVINQKARAQNANPRPKDKTGAMIANAAGVKTNNQEW